jgi:hypothetical protein
MPHRNLEARENMLSGKASPMEHAQTASKYFGA